MNWTRGRTLGRGSSATVWIALADHLSGQPLAVKSVELSESELLKRETKILASLNCHQIVAYKGSDTTYENGKFLYNLFMEYIPGGTITEVIGNHGGRLDEATVQSYTRQILLGLDYLHREGIVHCDIKGRNILVCRDRVKIADLGCAKMVKDHKLSGPVISGTPAFMAPEVARGEQQGYPADVWALGCTVIEMLTGRAPWSSTDHVSDPVSVLYQIGFSNDVPEIPSSMSKQGKDFLEKCLKRDQNDRWSVCELLDHPFVKICCDLDSPTSVLDQPGFWESVEETETVSDQNPDGMLISDSAPARRLQGLVREDKETLSLPNWDRNENWVTVRCNSSKLETTLIITSSCFRDTMLSDADRVCEFKSKRRIMWSSRVRNVWSVSFSNVQENLLSGKALLQLMTEIIRISFCVHVSFIYMYFFADMFLIF